MLSLPPAPSGHHLTWGDRLVVFTLGFCTGLFGFLFLTGGCTAGPRPWP